MTRQDFELIAETLKASRPAPHWDANKLAQWNATVNRFCERLRAINTRFNRDRFVSACGGLFFEGA
jgi:hypothetical protein